MENMTWDSFSGDGGKYIKTPKKMIDFFDEIEQVCKKYNLTIEGSHAGFSVREYKESDIDLLRRAAKHYQESYIKIIDNRHEKILSHVYSSMQDAVSTMEYMIDICCEYDIPFDYDVAELPFVDMTYQEYQEWRSK